MGNRSVEMNKWQELLTKHSWLSKTAPKAHLMGFIMNCIFKAYCGLEVRGVHNIPYGKRFVWTQNHSGWFALDAAAIAYQISLHNTSEKYDYSWETMGWRSLIKKLLPKDLDGDWGIGFFNNVAMRTPLLSSFFRAGHGFPVSMSRNFSALKDFRIMGTPAEGEAGNCKSIFTQYYKLQYFHSGVAQLALASEAEYLLPVVIIGPEETLPSLGAIPGLSQLLKTKVPLPAPIPPLPAKWIISFLPPISLKHYLMEYQSAEGIRAKNKIYRNIMDQVKMDIDKEMKSLLKGRKPFWPWFL